MSQLLSSIIPRTVSPQIDANTLFVVDGVPKKGVPVSAENKPGDAASSQIVAPESVTPAFATPAALPAKRCFVDLRLPNIGTLTLTYSAVIVTDEAVILVTDMNNPPDMRFMPDFNNAPATARIHDGQRDKTYNILLTGISFQDNDSRRKYDLLLRPPSEPEAAPSKPVPSGLAAGGESPLMQDGEQDLIL